MTASILDTAATTTGDNQPANFTVSAGSNRWLLLFIRFNDSTDRVTGVTYGTQAMTEVANFVGGSNDCYYLYSLDEAGIAAASSTAFSVTYSPGSPGNTRWISIAMSFQDADQTALGANEGEGETTDVLDVTWTAVASFGVGFAGNRHGTGTGTTHTWSNGWTETTQADSSDLDATSSVATKTLSAGSETATCTSGNDSLNDSGYIVTVELLATGSFTTPFGGPTLHGGIR
jgi:hypothetical protein